MMNSGRASGAVECWSWGGKLRRTWASRIGLSDRNHNPRRGLREARSPSRVLREGSQMLSSKHSLEEDSVRRTTWLMESGSALERLSCHRALEHHISPPSHPLHRPHSAQDPMGPSGLPQSRDSVLGATDVVKMGLSSCHDRDP